MYFVQNQCILEPYVRSYCTIRDDISSYFFLEASRNFRWHCVILFPRNRVSIHFYKLPTSQLRPPTSGRPHQATRFTPPASDCLQGATPSLWPLMTSIDLKRLVTPKVNMNSFQKGFTCLGSVHSQCWPLTASSDLKWPLILKIPTHSFPVLSQLYKNI